jgi:hypothetical protein
MLLFSSVIFELSLFFFYVSNDDQTFTALNMAAIKYKDSMIQSTELPRDLETVSKIAVFWDMTSYSMLTL